jgi:hypothetical protein
MSEFLYLVIGGLFSGVIVYIVKGFFSNQEDKVRDIKLEVQKRIDFLELKVDKLTIAHSEILNIVLEKFSKWEDRIKKIINDSGDIVSKVNNVETVPLSNNIRENLIRSLDDLDKTVKQDIEEIRRDMDRFDYGMKKTQSMIQSMKLNDKDKETLMSLLDLIVSNEKKSSRENKEIVKKIETMFSICKSLSMEHKVVEKKVVLLLETTRTKIKLTE